MKPVIFGFKGYSLSNQERDFFLQNKPSGFIIFSRNIESKEQVTRLIQELKNLFPERDTLILIDQEGGRVQRLTHPHAIKYPAPSHFAEIAKSKNIEEGLKLCYESNFLMAKELASLGINVNCTPVADLRIEGSHDVIGDRSFGSDISFVTKFCESVIKAHLDANVIPIIKHIPGHGRALCDSHKELPKVSNRLIELEQTDFAVFKNLSRIIRDKYNNSSCFAMTAHIKYECLDPNNPATQSESVIKYIRNKIGFSDKIITDCLTMEALSGSFGQRAIKSLEAGCDIVLHCSGDMDQMEEIAKSIY